MGLVKQSRNFGEWFYRTKIVGVSQGDILHELCLNIQKMI